MWRSGRLAGADPRGRLVAVEVRHLAVHEDRVVALGVQALDGFEPVGDDVDGEPAPAQQRLDHELVDRVVLGDEDAPAQRRPGGRGDGRHLGAARLDVGEHLGERLEQRGAPDRLGQEALRVGGRPGRRPRSASRSGLGASAGAARIARATSAPLIPGMSESSTTTS